MAAALLVTSVVGAPVSLAAPELPACGDVALDYHKTLADQHVRCVLPVNADSALEVSSDPAWTFTLRGVADQQFGEPTDALGESGALPMLGDIDGDGTPELLVVIGRGGTGGEPMAVWRLADQRFTRAGQLFGQRRFYRTTEGFFGIYAHSSAASGAITLYRWVDNTLTEVAVLDVAVAANGAPPARDWIHNGNTRCALVDGDRDAEMRAAGVDPATAAQRFCRQSWVSTVYHR